MVPSQNPPQPDPDAEAANARLAMKQIRNEISRILVAWDPLSLRGLKNYQLEYHPFVGPISIMVKKGAKPMEIARHLEQLMINEWRLPSDRAKCLDVAEKIHRTGANLRIDEARP